MRIHHLIKTEMKKEIQMWFSLLKKQFVEIEQFKKSKTKNEHNWNFKK